MGLRGLGFGVTRFGVTRFGVSRFGVWRFGIFEVWGFEEINPFGFRGEYEENRADIFRWFLMVFLVSLGSIEKERKKSISKGLIKGLI